MEEQELKAFIEWLPTKIKELEGKSPEEIVSALNQISKTEEGMNEISKLMEEFKVETEAPKSELFKEGGKLAYLVNCYKKGGKTSDCGCNKKNAKIIKGQDGVKTWSKWLLTPWNYSFNWRAPHTALPSLGDGRTRTLQRVKSPSGRQMDRVHSGGVYTERDVRPSGDTTFKVSNLLPDLEIVVGKNHPDYKFYQQRWKDLGIYRLGGLLNKKK